MDGSKGSYERVRRGYAKVSTIQPILTTTLREFQPVEQRSGPMADLNHDNEVVAVPSEAKCPLHGAHLYGLRPLLN
jgi:hypothetical protein